MCARHSVRTLELFQTRTHMEAVMFLDIVVLAGIGTVALMFAFFGGVGMFIWKDSHKGK